MSIENHGSVWCIDNCSLIASINLLDEREDEKMFQLDYLKPMYCGENKMKNAEIDQRLYLLKEIKANYFSKIKDEGLDETFIRCNLS